MKRTLACLATLAFAALASASEATPPIPVENQSRGTMPSQESWQEDVRVLIASIEKNDAAAARPFFFPRDAFLRLKAMKGADRYYDEELLKLYDRDIGKAHEQLKGQTGWRLAAFEKGRCVWKEKGTEYNEVPYWSCYRNKIHLEKDGTKVTIPLRTLINWGPRWYVTHLK